jgi:DegV family protein with EDD domain
MPVRIVTDSTCDLPPAVIAELGIKVVPLTVVFGDEAPLRDGIDITPSEFYERLSASSRLPKTSQPSVEAFRAAYEAAGVDGEEVVSIHVSSRLSGTLNAASIAREDVAPGIHVELIDSYNVSLGLGAIVLDAAAAAAAGASRDEVVAATRRTMDRVHVICLLDTLEYLQKGGRIGRAQSMLGSLLSIKPIIHVENGEIAPFERVRTRAKAIERLRQLALEDRTIRRLLVAYSGDGSEARAFAANLTQDLPHTDIRLTEIGPVVGVYTGPGGIGICPVRRD